MTKSVRISKAEHEALNKIKRLNIDVRSLSVMSNVFRVANSFRNHAEYTLLSKYELSFSGFTVLWVLWIWGPREPGILAEEAGITKGTLTGVLKTLEGLGLTQKQPHNTDGRRRIIEVTSKGKRIFRRLLPRFNELETSVTRGLSNKNKAEVVKALRVILQQTEKY